jgi:hypothetical protein
MDAEDLLWPLADSRFLLGEQKTTPEESKAALVAKRKWQRFAVDMSVDVRLTTQGPTRVVACEGLGTDISVGGLAVTADIDLPLGAQVGVEFTLPNSDRSLIFKCFVRNRQGNCYGVEFITENDDDYRKTGELQAILETSAGANTQTNHS